MTYEHSPTPGVAPEAAIRSVHERLEGEDLKSWLSCDPVAGVLHWKRTSGKGWAGHRAGAVGLNGRIYVRLKGRPYLAHRLIWWFDKGVWPTKQLDHINGDPTDNRISNLREVTGSENMQNLRKPTARNTSGYLGVSLNRSNRFAAHIRFEGKSRYLGSFSTPEEAYAAYVDAKRKHHVTCTI